jgi:hypothetical protein
VRRIALLVLFGLAACAAVAEPTANSPSEIGDWQTPAGNPPTRAEFAALVAACQDKVKPTAAEIGPMDGCLADLGLRRIQ